MKNNYEAIKSLFIPTLKIKKLHVLPTFENFVAHSLIVYLTSHTYLQAVQDFLSIYDMRHPPPFLQSSSFLLKESLLKIAMWPGYSDILV